MAFRIKFILICLAALAGCATPPVAQLNAAVMWQDEAFNYRPGRVSETTQSLFALDPAMEVSLQSATISTANTERRLEFLVSQLFHANGIKLAYTSGHSTGAAETWQNLRGDCLSLTILTQAAARALSIPAQMQEVRVPVAIDRRGGIDFLNGHVNVFIHNTSPLMINGRSFGDGGIVVDFEPQVGSRQRGKLLSDDEILARFYNNRAAEFLAQGDDDMAYAYYKAAITTDVKFAASYTNLAQLYSRRGLSQSAERLLHHAIALKDTTDSPLRALHGLLLAQGRDAEAQDYATKLRQHQDMDPYYWLGVGLAALQQSRYGKAIDALERAEALATGFDEIHRYLAVAYWRNGQQTAANKQLAVLTAMHRDDPATTALSKKIRRDPHETTIQ